MTDVTSARRDDSFVMDSLFITNYTYNMFVSAYLVLFGLDCTISGVPS